MAELALSTEAHHTHIETCVRVRPLNAMETQLENEEVRTPHDKGIDLRPPSSLPPELAPLPSPFVHWALGEARSRRTRDSLRSLYTDCSRLFVCLLACCDVLVLQVWEVHSAEKTIIDAVVPLKQTHRTPREGSLQCASINAFVTGGARARGEGTRAWRTWA